MSDLTYREILENTSAEIRRAAVFAGDIDMHLGETDLAHARNVALERTALQGVDHLRQSLDCLGLFVKRLAEQIGDRRAPCPEQLVKDLWLADLSNRLTGQPDDIEPSHDGPHTPNGNVTFF